MSNKKSCRRVAAISLAMFALCVVLLVSVNWEWFQDNFRWVLTGMAIAGIVFSGVTFIAAAVMHDDD